LEICFAIFANVLELDDQGDPVNEKSDPGAPANMAWVRWDRTAERLDDLIKLTEGNDQQ
jgi:hypothetical protein